MAGRHLSPEEKHIWSKVTQTVVPLEGRIPESDADMAQAMQEAVTPPRTRVSASHRAASAKQPPSRSAARNPAPILDDSWERRIATGTLVPEMTVDLHGHSLDMAHRRLNQTLAAALSNNVRILLVITGNPRPAAASSSPGGERARGAIRAEIGDWLAHSGHADAIASVRNAHPRHGGKGALYIILRRKR